jgi:mannose-6-phosphate isomerase-like protein (cupin superfamily)
MNKPVNLESKFQLFSDYWAPKVIAQMNDYQFKIVKIKGEFVWHEHKDTDETFFVIEGSMSIEFKDRVVELNAGEMIVVKRGEQHKPFAAQECKVMIIEPDNIVNTGESGGHLTAENDVWI